MCGAQEKVGLAIENLPDNEVLNAVKSTVNVKDINYFTVPLNPSLCLPQSIIDPKPWGILRRESLTLNPVLISAPR